MMRNRWWGCCARKTWRAPLSHSRSPWVPAFETDEMWIACRQELLDSVNPNAPKKEKKKKKEGGGKKKKK